MTAARQRTDRIVVYHTDTDDDIGVVEIRRQHWARGLLDIGFHYVIRRNGNFEFGRPEEQIGNHDRRLNKTSIAICVVGNDHFNAAQRQQLDLLIRNIHIRYPEAAYTPPEWLFKESQ